MLSSPACLARWMEISIIFLFEIYIYFGGGGGRVEVFCCVCASAVGAFFCADAVSPSPLTGFNYC